MVRIILQFTIVLCISLGHVCSFGAMICINKPNSIYKIDNVIDCQPGQQSLIVEFKLYKQNDKQYVTSAKALKVELLTCKTTHYFFGSKKETVSKSYADLTNWKYKSLINAGTCYNSNNVPVEGYPVSVGPVCVYTWPKTVTTTVTRCTFSSGVVITTHQGHMTSNLGNTLTCSYNAGFCKTHDKVAISYIPDPTEQDTYRYVGIFNGTMIGSHLIISSLGMSLKLENNVTKHSVHVVNGFKLVHVRTIDPNFVSKGHVLRSVLQHDIDMFKAEIRAKLSFLMDRIAKPTAEAKTLCEAIKRNNQLVRSIARVDPTQLVRMVLNNTYLIASTAGQDYITTYPCTPVDGIAWRVYKKGVCTTLIPISYEWNGETVDGFYDHNTRVISHYSPRVDCQHSHDQYFDWHGRLFVHRPGHKPTSLPDKTVKVLPMLAANVSASLVDFPESWIYNETMRLDKADLMWDYLDSRIESLENDQSYTDSMTSQDRNAGISFLGFTGVSLAHIIDGVLTIIFRIMAILGFWAFLVVKFITPRTIRAMRPTTS